MESSLQRLLVHVPLLGQVLPCLSTSKHVSLICFPAGETITQEAVMSHNWHTFNSRHILDTDNARGWNHAEQPYPNIARGAPESSSNVHPANSNTVQGGHVLAQWTPPPMSSGYPPPSVPNLEFPHYQYQPMVPCPSHDPFLQQSAAGDLHLLQLHHHSSSTISGQTVPGVHDVQASVSGRGTYKRKSSEFYDMGSTSRYHEVGRSSESQLPAVDSWQEKPGAESYHGHWNYPQSHGVNNFSAEGDHPRNVRSRTAPDIDHNPARTHLLNNSLYHPLSNEQSNLVDHWAQGSGSSTVECAYRSVPPSDNAIIAYGSDSRYNSHEPSPMSMVNNHRLEIGSCSNIHSMRNPAPPIVNSHINHHHVGGVRIGNRQRSFRASSSSIRPGHVQTSGERVISGPSLPLSDPRPHTTLRFRNSERNGRIMTDRYRSLAEANFRDHHRDMRLDVDNMSYEELLALGERIGSVSTGLSDTLISKCLIESIYCSSDTSEDEGNCVICLDEYINMDDVGTLKACGHDFHVACIRKWLSMKNLCPICKATALDNSK